MPQDSTLPETKEEIVPTIDSVIQQEKEEVFIAIKSEEEFQEVLAETIKSTEEHKSYTEDFQKLADALHASLGRQDSDGALALVTRWALALGSSDIHYDVGETRVSVRMRIDGELGEILSLEPREYKLMLERLKYRSDLKLNITNVPQDGKYRITDGEGKIDVRVSTLPVKYGENAVCRILDSTKSIPDLSELGFMWTSKRQIDRSMKKKNGTILVTGPTGSGKTTTLYSVLQTLNTPEKKIITLEDPVEYEIPGIVQSEVDEHQNYTYNTGLKALLRQDPDIIMIGEIRDLESATIAMQAAMTGHLVLSTLHTKSASETIERLMNMWVPNYIISSGLDVIIAQRLVRRLCPHCTESYPADTNEINIIKWMMKDMGMEWVATKTEGYKLYKSKWCSECGMTGYKGRIGIYEVMSFSENIRKLIRGGSSPHDIMEEARKNDLILMREDGIMKAMQGKTSLEELFKVIE
jgi:type IV pilus assembly protein PilB